MLSATVREAARRFGERTALVSPTGWCLGYAGLDRLADEVAASLLDHGVAERDVVALVLPPCPEYVVLQVAAARLGAIAAGVNHRLSPPERAAVLEVAGPRLVVATPELAAPAHPVVHLSPAGDAESALAGLRVAGARVAEPPHDPDRPLGIVFTSGTTGTPRGAVFAGRQIAFITAVDTGGHWGDPALPPPHSMSGMSLTHLGPTTKLEGNLMKGGTTHLLERWSPTTALELTERHRMAAIAGIPTQVALMLHHPRVAEFDLSSVRAVVMGGGPATPALVREVREILGVPVMVRYACTEAGIGVGTGPTDPPDDAELTVGRPHAGVELTIRSGTGELMPTGEVGEVCLRSEAVMAGYWNDPGATAAAKWGDGAVRTSDLGRLDPQGRLRLVGRAREMYVRGGYNVYPMEVESVLAACPGVRDLAIVARPDDVMGEVGVAVVVASAGGAAPTLDDLRAFGGATLARHKLPESVLVVDSLPLTPMEKLDRRALAAMVDRSP